MSPERQSRVPKSQVELANRCFFLFFFYHHFYFPAHLVGDFTLSDLLDKPWSQLSSGQAVVTAVVPSTPRYVPSILSRVSFSIPTARRFSSNVANSRSCAFRQSIIMQEKVPTYEYVHSVRVDLAKLILVGTRTTYQATGDFCLFSSYI